MPGQTLTQKIIALHCKRKEVQAGELVDANVDIALANDITGAVMIRYLNQYDGVRVFDRNKLVLVNDHFAPNKDVPSAEQCKMMHEFARKHNLKYFFGVGDMGIEHILLPEQGIVMPYDLVIGADSHTCTYGGIGAFSTGVGSEDLAAIVMCGKVWLKVPAAMKFVLHGQFQKYVGGKDLILYTIGDIGVDGANYMSMEFVGDGASSMPISDRLTVANMAIEAGAKNGIFGVDNQTLAYIRGTKRFKENSRFREFRDLNLKSDGDAEYVDGREYDLSKIEPQVAFPYLPSNVHPISEVEQQKIKVNQVSVGMCTNGNIEDLRVFAEVFRGHRRHKDVRLIVIPGTQYVWLQGVKEGIAQMIVEGGGVYSTPTCGPCLGGHMGVLGTDEVALTTTNRNFLERGGHKTSKLYLANPAVAAATAINGFICGPEALK
jgi:3-isopropylmalate/(R)-2-methylmalate dehydratase large subunit